MSAPSLWQRLLGLAGTGSAVSRPPPSGGGAVVASAPPRQPWDPVVLARVRQLHVSARVLTEGMTLGQHRSRRIGQAVEFADYQEYAPGMDLRHVDWKVWARSDRHVVRRYEAETELPCTVMVDLSGDLSTGSVGTSTLPALVGTKAGAALTLAATLVYWLHRQGEPVGLRVVGGEGMQHAEIPPARGRSHLQLMFRGLASARPAGRAELATALAEVGARTRRRSLVLVLSDGMEEPARWLPSLGAFTRRGTDLRFLHLYDPAELRMEREEPVVLFSPEGGEGLAVDPGGARREFGAVVGEYLAEVRAGVLRHGGQYVAVPTDRPLDRAFRQIAAGGSSPVVAP